MKEKMIKKLEDFIDDIKRQDGDVPSIEGANDRDFFCKDDGCPSQPINKEEKPTLFDELLDGYASQTINKEEKPTLFDELGGIPAPESGDWNEEDKNEEEKVPSKKRLKNFFKNFFQTQGLLPEDDGDKI